eukprot:gene2974-12981_t
MSTHQDFSKEALGSINTSHVLNNEPPATIVSVAPKVASGRMTQTLDAANPLEWDLNCWQHAKPAVFSNGRGAGCTQPLSMGTPCSIRILNISEEIGLGVCLKRAGLMDVYWKLSCGSNGLPFKFCSTAVTPLPYGEPFKAGDVVTLRIRDGALEYDINGRPQGAAFTGFHAGMGDLYVRAHMANSLSIHRKPNANLRSMTKEQQIYYLHNVGHPSESDPKSKRTELEILLPTA